MKCTALLILASLFASPSVCRAQNSTEIAHAQPVPADKTSQFRPEETVVKIATLRINPKESLKRVGLTIVSSNATGWCLGRGKCDFILTNYYVAERAGFPLNFHGIKVLQT